MSQPKLLDTPLYALLHKDDISGFNKERPRAWAYRHGRW